MPRAPQRNAPRQANAADGDFEAFFQAIMGQESGGDYRAVNARTGASGLYQVMPANIGPWSEQVLGRRVSVAEFRGDPEIQTAVARGIMEGYFKDYGARGAASAWYSGNPKKQNQYKRFRPNEPSIGEYVDQVIARIKPGSGSANTAEQRATVRPQSGSANAAESRLGQPLAPSTTQPLTGFQAAPPPAPTAKQSGGFGFKGGDPFPAFGGGGTQQASRVPPTETAVVNATEAAAATGPLPGETGSEFRDRVVSSAMTLIGVPYVWGGTSATGVDCSGLIQRVLGQMGYKVPRVSSDQARFGKKVAIAELRPGDLVAADNSSRNNGADHIAFYAGDGYIIEAARAGTNVRRRKLGAKEDYYGVQLQLPGD